MSLIFDLPDIKCQYSLNNIGSPLYGSLTDLLQKPFETCKVGTGTGEQYLPSTRNGKFRTTEIVFENREELNSLIMSKLECFMDDYQEYLQFDINNTYIYTAVKIQIVLHVLHACSSLLKLYLLG